MRALIIFACLLITANAGDSRFEIAWAYRKQNWQEVERLATRVLYPRHHRHVVIPDYEVLHFKLGVALWHQGKWRVASQSFHRSVHGRSKAVFNPNRLQALLGMSDCAHRLGEYGTSIRLAKRFLKEAPPREWRRKSPFANGPMISGDGPIFCISKIVVQ